jgi:peptide/nickel transport system permease protein
MRRYLLQRLLHLIPVLLGVSILSFALVHLVPGDPVTTLLGTRYTEDRAETLRREYGLDQPLPVQYLRWLGKVVQGDLGTSTTTGQPVREAMAERLPVTVQLVGWSLSLGLLLAIPLGTLAAVHRGKKEDHLASVTGLLGLSVPNFWLATLLILFFSLHLGWLPSGGYRPLSDGLGAHLRHLILPALALGGAVAAVILRMTRSAMLEVLDQDYMLMARAKGVPPFQRIVGHGLKNAFIPVLTVIGIQAGFLLGGSVVIEEVFSLPGLGRLTLQAIQNRDYALVQGCILFIATAFTLINLAVDIAYALLNPKLRAGGKA